MRGRLGRTQLKEITICNVEKSFQNDLAVNRRVSAQSLVLSKCRNSIPEKERETMYDVADSFLLNLKCSEESFVVTNRHTEARSFSIAAACKL